MKKSKSKENLENQVITFSNNEEVHYGGEPQPEWDEVVKDKLCIDYRDRFGFEVININDLVKNYFGIDYHDMFIPVRIKCRKGMIQIERVQK